MKAFNIFSMILIIMVFSGCATVLTEKANDKVAPKGVRVFPPKTYLFVNNEKQQTTIHILPDYKNAYDINPLTIVAAQDFSIQMEDGMIKQFNTNQDTTSFTNLFKAISENLKESSPSGASAGGGNTMAGTFNLDDGIYIISNTGEIEKIQ